MINQWLIEQQQQQNTIYFMLDPLAEPNPIATLLINQAIKHYAWLYQNTPYESLQESSPSIIQIADIHNQGVQKLINHPEQNWGWLFSTEQGIAFQSLIEHWQQRLTLIYEGQEVFYRFHDNRVMARPLKTLTDQQLPKLLGHIQQLAVWDGDTWQTYQNPAPNHYPLTSKHNLAWALPEPSHVAKQIRFNNLYNWLINTFTADVFIEAQLEQTLEHWLTEQISLADSWQWHQETQYHYLLEQKLQPSQANNPQWYPLKDEMPEQHYQRMLTTFNTQLPRKPLDTTLDTSKLT